MAMEWEEEVKLRLVRLHPADIIRAVIRPGVDQVIKDYEWEHSFLVKEEDRKRAKNLVSFWKEVQKKIRLAR